MRNAIFIALLMLVVASAAMAQTDIDTITLSSRILPTAPSTPTGFDIAMQDMSEQPAPIMYLFSPLFLTNDSAWLASATVGVIRAAALKTSATFTYTYIDPDGPSGNLDSFGFAVKQELVKRGGGGINFLAGYSDTRDAATKAQIGGAGEIEFARGLTGGVDVRWVNSSAGDGVSDVVPRLYGAFKRGKITVGAKYTLENDVDRKTDYGVDVMISTARGLVVIGGGKDSALYANFQKVF